MLKVLNTSLQKNKSEKSFFIRIKEFAILLLVSFVVWISLMPIFSSPLAIGGMFSFIPVIIAVVIVYKIIEKLLALNKLKLRVVVGVAFATWLLFFWIFSVLPSCGSSAFSFGGFGTFIDCDCKGVQIKLDTSGGLDAYSSKMVCLGFGKSYLGGSEGKTAVEACRSSNCQENTDFKLPEAYFTRNVTKTINCKTGMIEGEKYPVDMRGIC